MRVVVTGGTGFVGSALSAALAARGDDVTILTRGVARELEPAIHAVPWEPGAAGDWQRYVEEADAVVGLAGAGVMDEKWTPARLKVLHDSRIAPTRLVAEAVARAHGAGRKPVLVSASAIGIYGMREGDEKLTEAGAHGTDVLAKMCEAWEAASSPAKDAGARVPIARLGIVLGPGGALERMAQPFRAFVGGPIGAGTQIMSWVHLSDAVRALLFAIDTAGFEGPFNVTAPNPVTMNDMAAAIGKVLRRPSFLRAPAFAIRAALGERADLVLTGQRAVPAALLAAGFRFSFEHVGEALKDILATR
jgi:uncharacterized protein